MLNQLLRHMTQNIKRLEEPYLNVWWKKDIAIRKAEKIFDFVDNLFHGNSTIFLCLLFQNAVFGFSACANNY